MLWLILEALLALALLLLIVWWTMFSGRRKGEPTESAEDSTSDTGSGTDPRRGGRS